MLSAILGQLFPSGLCWLILSGMIDCLNGWGLKLDTIGSTGWTMVLLILSFAVLVVAVNFFGACPGLSVSPAFTIGKTDFYIEGKDVWTSDKSMRGAGGLFLQFIINLIKCMVVFPVVGIVNLIMCLIKRDFVGDLKSASSAIPGYITFGVAFLLFIFPFGLHKTREITYDCTKFEYSLEDIYYTEGDGDRWIYIDLNVKHPSKEISSICGKFHFYLDGELVETTTYKLIHNRSTTGLLSIKPGDKEDLPEITITTNFARYDIDFVNLFSQRSDRLVIVHELTEASFMKDMVVAGWEYCETLPTTTIYSSEEYKAQHDNSEKNRNAYLAAVALYNEGRYEEAIAAFRQVIYYGDAAEYIRKCEYEIIDKEYVSAVALYNESKYEEALVIFERIHDHRDSSDYINECNNAIAERQYLKACEFYANGEYEKAYVEFIKIENYKDSLEYIEKIANDAIALAESYAVDGSYDRAMALLEAVEMESAEIYSACEDAIDGYFSDLVTLLGMENFVISEGVELIKPEAFAGCVSLRSVVFPSSIRQIGYFAFADCINLGEVTLPSGIELIGEGAFDGCRSLISINLPDSISELGDGILHGCKSIEKISTCLNPVYKIADLFHAEGMYPVAKKNIPASLKTIEITSGSVIPKEFFSHLPNTVSEILFAESIVEIGEYAYAHSALSINIPSSVKVIKNGAFLDMPTVDEIVVPEGVETIGDEAFGETNFRTIYLPSTLISLGNRCFKGKNYGYNGYLKNIYFNGSKAKWQSVVESLWAKDLGSYPSVVKLHCSDATYSFNEVTGKWENK